jgi:HEAT repeat protein
MCTLFSDRAPEVRAQAAAWCAATPSAQGIACLITELDDGDGQCRFAAQDALIRIGLPAFEALTGALDAADDHVTGRILVIAAAVGDERSFVRAEAMVSDPSPTIRALAASVLASTGNPHAGSLLVTLLDDDSDDVVLAAIAGLARLSYWPAAASVERVLSHPSWELRQRAVLALSALGAPGLILLRSEATGRGPAAEMAAQALRLQTLSTKEKAA